MIRQLPITLLTLLLLLLPGCASYTAKTAPGIELSKYRKVFVENNLNDNKRIEYMIVASLRKLGIEAENGPPTMKPNGVDAVLRYSDHWTWDFSEHITLLQIELVDARKHHSVAYAEFSGSLSMKTSAEEIVDRLVKALYFPPAKKKKG